MLRIETLYHATGARARFRLTLRALDLAKRYDPDQTDIVAYGCTAAGFIGGPGADANIQRELGAITGKPVVTTANAMIEVLRPLGAGSVAVVTPYLDMVSDRLRAYLEQSGIAVTKLASFKAATTAELAAITPLQIKALALETMTSGSDAMFIACSQLPTLEIIDTLANGSAGRSGRRLLPLHGMCRGWWAPLRLRWRDERSQRRKTMRLKLLIAVGVLALR